MSAATESETTEQQQPALRVQDALGYLDQVKSKFNDQPFVYNQFLDIMKEFKSQSLDTPGVIAKVSTLFRGHTDLIVGFNTFLPPGYRIEQMPHNNEIRITTLQGINLTPATYTLNQQQPPLTSQHQQPPNSLPTTATTTTTPQQQAGVTIQAPQQLQIQQPPHPQQTIQVQANANSASIQQQPISLTQPPQSLTPQQQPSQVLQAIPMQTSTPQPTAVVIAATTPQSQPSISPSAMQPGTEFGFNHALNYVNKIKHRFSANPEIYQQFLEILHTYQRDQHATKVPRSKMLLESEVYNQVARLFQNQRDLLEEFSQFLPDANGTGTAGSNINSLTRVHHQLSPNASINSNQQNLSLRHVSDGSVVINNDIAPVKRQNARANHQSKMAMKRQNNSGSTLSYNSSKVS